ncbi:MAG: hypothetical protein Q9213_003732 [Squamulea squamosa]
MRSSSYAFHEEYFKLLWGNSPALNALNLADNEGLDYDKDLNLLFAASGDFRNIVATVNTLPGNYSNAATTVINDRDDLLTARTVIFLLIALIEDSALAAELILHLWYSSRLTPTLMSVLGSKITPEMSRSVEAAEDKNQGDLISQSWSLHSATVSVHLSRTQWYFILKVLQAKHSVAESEPNRQSITVSKRRSDHRERHYYNLTPSMRLCSHKFRQGGVLLPFGYSDKNFNVVNPTLFNPETGNWQQRDIADPLLGYDIASVSQFPVGGSPKEDINGRLYFYVLSSLRKFHHQLRSIKLKFVVHGVDATILPKHLPSTLGFATNI